jgi:drug/metabolite transporter (DMT)-like permease
MEFLGPLNPVLAAFCWAIAVVLFKKSGATLTPAGLNSFKNVLALCLFGITGLAIGDPFLMDATPREFWSIFVSGIVGISLADTLFLQSLNILGAGRKAIVDCLYSPFVVLFAYVLLGETMEWVDMVGGLLVLTGILLASGEKTEELAVNRLVLGVALGAASMALMGISAVWVKPILEKYSTLSSTSVRLLGGVFGLALWASVHRRTRTGIAAAFKPQRVWRFAVPAAILGTYLALFFWVGGFKYIDASTAAILNQTSTLFVVVFAWAFLGEPLSRRRLVSVGTAFAGAVLVLI